MKTSFGMLAFVAVLAFAGCTGNETTTVVTPNGGAGLTVQSGGGAPGSAINVNFTTAGSQQTFVAVEGGFTQAFTIANTCSTGPVANLSPTTANGPSAQFTLASASAGKCSVTISDGFGHAAVVNVTVTTTSGSVQ